MRPLRLVALFLFAACASATTPSDVTLRVLVYNIHAGRDASGVDNLERVAALVASTNADIVLLQEVDRNTTRSGNVDQLATLIRLTKFEGFFGKSLDYQGGDYGIAVLSRRRITAHEVIPMRTDPPQPRAGGSIEPRVALVVDTSTEAGPIRLINTHFDASREDTWRAQEVEQLLQAINRTGPPPQLVGGDFNSTPDSVVHNRMLSSGMRDSWIECGTNAGLSYPANTPEKRIDYLYLGPAWRCTSAIVIDTQASDHRPVLITLRRAKNG